MLFKEHRAMTNTIELVEEFLGDKLTVSSAQSLASMPTSKLAQLFERLAPSYYDWLENESKRRESEAIEIYHLLDPYPRRLPWQKQLEKCKGLALYFPRFTLPDPIASTIWPLVTWSLVLQRLGEKPEVRVTNKLRLNLEYGLSLLAELSPLINTDEVRLIPSAFALDYNVVQVSTQNELDALSEEELASRYRVINRLDLGTVKQWGRICAMADLTPVAAKGWVNDVLKVEYETACFQRTPQIQTRMAENLLNYQMPGISKISLREIIALRQKEDAFYQFRRSFAEVLDIVHKESPPDQAQFEIEFREAAETVLRPRIEDIEKRLRGSSALAGILKPTGLLIGGGIITFLITGTLPISVPVGTGLVTVSWVAERIYRRFSKSGRSARLVRQFYGYLIPSSK
jgi:hypothetical protein